MIKAISKLLVIGFMTMILLPFFVADVNATIVPGSGGSEIQEKWASSPSECGANFGEEPPKNCLFLEEPIGGKENYDLYVVTCEERNGKEGCTYKLWSGGYVPSTDRGPIQALLTFEADKAYQGPFGLLYNYLGLIYKYMSGLIVGIAVLFVVIGGIQMTTSYGDTAKFDEGKKRIINALIGIVLWFTASLILYTINPTFFAF